MAFPGSLRLIDPLKTTTAEIYEGWRQEAERLRKRLRILAREERADRNESGCEAEGLRSRLRALHDLIAEAVVLEGDPETWQREAETVRLGSRITLELRDGQRELLFVGLAGPSASERIITPAAPLGAAVLGRRVGETVTFRAGGEEFTAAIRRCLIPGDAAVQAEDHGRLRFFAEDDELREANRVVLALSDLQRAGLPLERIAVTWRAPYQSWALEKALTAVKIPYQIDEACSFFGQPLIAGILALLRLLLDPGDAAARAAARRAFGEAQKDPYWDEEEAAACADPVAIAAGREDLRDAPPVEVLRELLGALGLGGQAAPFRSPWPGLYSAAGPHRSVRSFLAHVEEIQAARRRGDRRGLRLAPLPRLERGYDALFIIGANEGALPFGDAGDILPAERALFYAAIAAAERATVSWTRAFPRSRLLAEIADEGALPG